MKQIKLLFVALFTLSVANTFAANYDLKVAGVQVTDANKNNITGTGISGSVSYNSAENTLTLNNATISISSNYAVSNEIAGLTINLVGENNLTSSYAGIYSDKDIEIVGSGSLTISNGVMAIFLNNGDLIIKNTTVTATGQYGIMGHSTEFLIVQNSSLKVTGTSSGSISKIKNLVLDRCAIIQPTGAAFDDALEGIAIDGALVKEEVVIEPIEEYALSIVGTKVTSLNASDVLGDGRVSYDAEKNTLTLNNANITTTTEKKDGIYNYINDLNIMLIGENRINANSLQTEGGYIYGIHSYKNIILTGSGSLTIDSEDDGILLERCNLTIENTTVTVYGRAFGIRGENGINEVLTINNSTVKARSKISGSIGNINNLVLDGCEIIQPAGAAFDASQKAVCLDGEIVKTEVVIWSIKKYDLRVAGVQVTDENKDDITGTGISGSVSYNSAENTLTLDNATISISSNYAVSNEIAGLTINLVGENNLTSSYAGIYSDKNIKIVGSGSLTISNGIMAIFLNNGDLTIKNTTVTATGQYGIMGNSTEVLTVENSSLKVTGTSYSSISNIKNLVLNGCEIIQPTGAAFDASQNAVCKDGEIVKTEVVIGPETYNLWVAGVQVNTLNAADVLGDGTISYNSTKNILTLNGATINSTQNNGIENKIADLTIDLIGKNYINSSIIGIYSTKEFKIIGTGSLTLNQGHIGIYHDRCDLTIENTTITANGSWYGICGYKDDVLTIINSTIKATGTDKGSMCQISNLVLDGCEITQPAGAAFDDALEGIAIDGALIKEEVVIEPIKEYALWIVGTQVTSLNAADVFKNGRVSYDAEKNTLTLENTSLNTYDSAAENGIKNNIEGLKINLIGANRINAYSLQTAGNLSVIYSTKNIILTGNGSLTINSEGDGIFLKSCNLTIENTTVTAYGRAFGIRGQNGSNEVLTINNSTVEANGTASGSIGNIKNLVLDGCEIIQPAGAAFDASQKAVCLDGEIVTDEVVIEPIEKYALWVADVQVDASNCHNLTEVINDTKQGSYTERASASGTIDYDPSTNTLLLYNASLICELIIPLENEIEGLTIVLMGENTLETKMISNSVSLRADTKIMGTGSLYVKNISWNGIFIKKDCNLTIENTTVEVKVSHKYGIGNGDENGAGTLTIINSTVKSNNPLCYLENIILQDCAISSPEGAAFDATLKGIAKDGEIVKEVVISPVTAINNVEIDKNIFAHNGRIFGAENARIYDVLGRDVTRMNGNLQGIYVVKTEKTVTKIVVK